MSILKEIVSAIEQLSEHGVDEIEACLFDRDIARDAGGGLLASLIDEATGEARSRHSKLL